MKPAHIMPAIVIKVDTTVLNLFWSYLSSAMLFSCVATLLLSVPKWLSMFVRVPNISVWVFMAKSLPSRTSCISLFKSFLNSLTYSLMEIVSSIGHYYTTVQVLPSHDLRVAGCHCVPSQYLISLPAADDGELDGLLETELEGDGLLLGELEGLDDGLGDEDGELDGEALTELDGEPLGELDGLGLELGLEDGELEIELLGLDDGLGLLDGLELGELETDDEGLDEGEDDTDEDGLLDGELDGLLLGLGLLEGLEDGLLEAEELGLELGELLGEEDGLGELEGLELELLEGEDEGLEDGLVLGEELGLEDGEDEAEEPAPVATRGTPTQIFPYLLLCWEGLAV